MSSFLQHVVFGVRLIRKSPIFYLIVILVLALGIGANAAVFSVVDAVLLRKLPFRDPDRLVMVWEKNPTLGAMIGDRVPTAYTNFVEWVQQAHAFDGNGWVRGCQPEPHRHGRAGTHRRRARIP